MIGRWMRMAVIGAIVACLAGDAFAHPCGVPNFAFGNAGYGAGYSIAGVHGWRSHCGGWPGYGGAWWCGGPRLGFGGFCGTQRWSGCESVYLSVPPCGGATFFSGGVVPFVGGWPMNWYPGYAFGPWGLYPYAVPAPVGVGPQFGPAGLLPFLGAASGGTSGCGRVAATTPVARTAVAARVKPAIRMVNDAARRRAARLVATGDRHLRETQAGAPARARAAVDAYRRAATTAPDDPDIRIREALALVALGDMHAADAALARAVAIDGRFAAAPPRRVDLPPDPVFGDRPAEAPAPLVARGQALVREIGGADAAAVAWLAARWSDRWAGPAAAVASR